MIDNLINDICKAFSITREELGCRRRDFKLVQARVLLSYILRKHTNLSTTAIAKLINRHHSTIVHYATVAEAELKYNREFRAIRDSIEPLFMRGSLAEALEREYKEIRGNI